RRSVSRSQVRQSIRRLMAVDAPDRAQLRGIKPTRASQILGGAVVAYETMRCLRIEHADVSPWALREGIVLEHLSSLRGPNDRLTLQPVIFNDSTDSAIHSMKVLTLLHDWRFKQVANSIVVQAIERRPVTPPIDIGAPRPPAASLGVPWLHSRAGIL